MQAATGGSWGIENPTHHEGKPELWKMPEVERLSKMKGVQRVTFDQCRYGAETAKPTVFLSYGLDFEPLDGVTCNHPKKTWKRADGSTYEAAHESPVQRWRNGPKGRERASRALGEYSADLSSIIATGMHLTQRRAGWLAEELEEEEL